MRKIINAAILTVFCLLLLYFSPGIPSMMFIALMTGLVATGYILGILRMNSFAEGFTVAMTKMNDMKKISASDNWLYIKQMDSFFHNMYLDALLQRYIKKVDINREAGKLIYPDIEDSINEDYLALRSQKNFIAVIPGALTGLGILGTFYGLLTGLGGIRFSSVDVVIDSIASLVGGIDTAFYTSIAGVALSLCFEILTKLSWNNMLENLLEFYEHFHTYIFPSSGDQKDTIQLNFMNEILTRMEGEKQ